MNLTPRFRPLGAIAIFGIFSLSPALAAITVTSVDQYVDASSYNDDADGPAPVFEATVPGAFSHTAGSSVNTASGAASITSKLASRVTLKSGSLFVNATQDGSFSLTDSASAASYTTVTVSFTASAPFTYKSNASTLLGGDDFGEPLVSLTNDKTGTSVFEYISGTPPTSGENTGKLPAGDYTLLAESDVAGDSGTGDTLAGAFGFGIDFSIIEAPVLKVNAPASTNKPKLRITGTSKSAIEIKRVDYQIAGKGKYRRAKGTNTWSFNLRLKTGVNKVTIRVTDAEGNTAVQKIQIQRTAAN